VQSARDTFWKVFEAGNVKDRAAGNVFGEAVGVKIDADFDRMLADKGHLVMSNIEVPAIGKADPERLERFWPEAAREFV